MACLGQVFLVWEHKGYNLDFMLCYFSIILYMCAFFIIIFRSLAQVQISDITCLYMEVLSRSATCIDFVNLKDHGSIVARNSRIIVGICLSHFYLKALYIIVYFEFLVLDFEKI
jgi:hypothetical protein